jgi:hypothetical protein
VVRTGTAGLSREACIVIERQLRVLAATAALVVATLGVLAWSLTAGSAVAAATTRLRSGAFHTQLVSHVSPSANTVSSGLALHGTDVMAAVVGVMAILSVAFLIVTFIRRRVTAA